MTNGGFLTQKRTSPLGLGLVVAGHAAVLTALALAPPEAIQRITYVKTIVENIADPTPPPKLPPPPPKQARQTPPTQIEKIVDTGPSTPPIEFRPLPPLDLTPPLQQPPLAEPKFVPASADPGAISRFQPGYPSALARADIEGSVTVRVLIGADGRVKTVEMVRADNVGFFEATKEHALRAWRFRPATRDGVATESWRTMTVHFKLES